MNNKHLAGIVFATALLAVAAVPLSGVQAATVFSDNFDSDVQGTEQTPTGWSLTTGNVDILGPGFYDYYPGNGNYVDLDGNTLGGIATITTFGPGGYTLTFDLGGNANDDGSKTTDISLGDWSTSLTLKATDPLALYTFTFITSVTGSLTFSMEAGGNEAIGNILDNVALSTTTPLPAALPFFASGLGVMGLLLRRRKRNAAVLAT